MGKAIAGTCEYGVWVGGEGFNPPHLVVCGEPAVAAWGFGGEHDDVLLVCPEHDRAMAGDMKPGDKCTRTALVAPEDI